MKDKAHVEAWIYSCYKTVGTSAPGYAFNIEGSTDEFTTPKVWWANTVFRHPMAYATISSSSNQAQWWRELYGTIGHVHLFLRELDRQNPSFLTEDDKALYRRMPPSSRLSIISKSFSISVRARLSTNTSAPTLR